MASPMDGSVASGDVPDVKTAYDIDTAPSAVYVTGGFYLYASIQNPSFLRFRRHASADSGTGVVIAVIR